MLNEKIVLPTILEAETKVKIADQVIKMIQDEARSLAGNIIDDLFNCESPIEQLLSVALTTSSNRYTNLLNTTFEVFEIERQQEIEYKDILGKIQNYRADFLLTVADQSKDCFYKFIVECDGFEFHSSKEKFESDRQRDRKLLTMGYITMRFSGKEIVENPGHCAHDILRTICKYIQINKTTSE